MSGQRRDLLDRCEELDDPLEDDRPEDDLLDDRDDEVPPPWLPLCSPADSDRSAPSDRLKDPAPRFSAMAPDNRVPVPSPPAPPAATPWKAP